MSGDGDMNLVDSVIPLDSASRSADIANMQEVSLMTQEELNLRKIIYPGMQQRNLLNAFRDLRTRLTQKWEGKNFVLLVSSLHEKSGSSFVAINAATSFALDEQKTAVYVDCNIENSYANNLIPRHCDNGLMDYLENPSLSVEDIIYCSGIPRVRVIPPGNKGEVSVERMGSARMQELIVSLKRRYPDRFIVLDIPSVSDSPVARILSSFADMAILVVPFGKATSNQVLSGIDAVGEEKFAGLVFNNS
jgi:Mrp family chromosome partitioning ATPase